MLKSIARSLLPALLFARLLPGMPGPAAARTIVLTARDADMMAAIAAEAPRHSWAAGTYDTGVFSASQVDLQGGRGFLIRYPLDVIPPGQRIMNAQWRLPVIEAEPEESRLYIWRLLGEWGAGVSYLNRRAGGEEEPWAKPGARANSVDRSGRPTAVIKPTDPQELTINVTRDIELWYSGLGRNHGWLLSIEDDTTAVSLESPFWEGMDLWELRITYVPR